jgi:hypothetical protein
MGGTGDSLRSLGLANLVSLCRSCHDHVHACPQESCACGFLIRSGHDPEDIPLQAGAIAVWLSHDGSLREEIPPFF